MSKSDIAVRVRGLSKSYTISHNQEKHITLAETMLARLKNPLRRPETETFWALKDIEFDIKKGDVVGIIGRNGAGKSTLLKILSRITEPTTGKIELFGRVGSLLEVGTGFHPELTGRENIFLNGAILGMSKAEIKKQFDAIVDFAGVEQFLDTPVKRYSSGMYVRLAFAVAAHLEIEILVVDEVLAVGDAEFQKKCLGKMKDVAAHGRTVLFVSHNVPAVQALCSHGILLQLGKIRSVGPIEKCLDVYLSSARRPLATDVKTISVRQGRGRARFTSIWLENLDGSQVTQCVSGEPLVVAMEYASDNDADQIACRFSAGFFSLQGQDLFNCSSELSKEGFASVPTRGVVRCHIERFPLSGGDYLLCPFLEVDGQIEDWLVGGLIISVTDGDFYGSGKLYPQGWQGRGVLVEHGWRAGPASKPQPHWEVRTRHVH